MFKNNRCVLLLFLHINGNVDIVFETTNIGIYKNILFKL